MQPDRRDPCTADLAGIRNRQFLPLVLVRASQFAGLPLTPPRLAQGKLSSSEQGTSAPAQTRADKLPDSVEGIAARGDQRLQRFSAADPDQPVRLHQRLDAPVARRNPPLRVFFLRHLSGPAGRHGSRKGGATLGESERVSGRATMRSEMP